MAVGRDEAVEQVRDAVDIVQVIGESVALRRSGSNMVGLCPFHSEKSPSFTVSPTRQVFHCFGCGAGGDIFRFVMQAEGLTFPEALRRLADRAGITLPERSGGERGERGKLAEVLERATVLYEKCLAHPEWGAATRTYLETRGIAPETARLFRLGYAPRTRNMLATKAPALVDQLVTVGLAGRADDGRVYDRFRDRLVFPVLDAGGRVIGHGARAMAREHPGPKYLNSPETPLYHKGKVLYGLPFALQPMREAAEAVLVEGYTDLLSLYQAGVKNVVAACGTAFTPQHAEALGRLVRKVVLAYDADTAGQTAARRTAGILLDRGFHVRIARFPDGEDPDSFVQRHGARGAEQVLRDASDAMRWVIDGAGRDAASDPPSARIERAAAFVGLLDDELRRRALAEDAASLLKLPVDVLLEGVERARREEGRAVRAPRTAAQSAPDAQAAPVAATEPQRGRKERVLALAIVHHDLAWDVVHSLPAEAFVSPELRAIRQWLHDGGEPPADMLALVSRLTIEGESVGLDEARREMGEVLPLLHRDYAKRRVQELLQELQRLTEHGAPEADRAALLGQLQTLDAALRRD